MPLSDPAPTPRKSLYKPRSDSQGIPRTYLMAPEEIAGLVELSGRLDKSISRLVREAVREKLRLEGILP